MVCKPLKNLTFLGDEPQAWALHLVSWSVPSPLPPSPAAQWTLWTPPLCSSPSRSSSPHWPGWWPFRHPPHCCITTIQPAAITRQRTFKLSKLTKNSEIGILMRHCSSGTFWTTNPFWKRSSISNPIREPIFRVRMILPCCSLQDHCVIM